MGRARKRVAGTVAMLLVGAALVAGGWVLAHPAEVTRERDGDIPYVGEDVGEGLGRKILGWGIFTMGALCLIGIPFRVVVMLRPDAPEAPRS